MSIESLIDRLAQLRKDTSPDSIKTKTALIRIGAVLQAQMKINAPIKTGNLRQRIQYVLKKVGEGTELSVGSFATPYAAVIEYGYNGVQQVREYQRRGKKIGRKKRQIYTVRAHPRKVNRRARPYIQPAVEKQAQFIIDMIKTITEP